MTNGDESGGAFFRLVGEEYAGRRASMPSTNIESTVEKFSPDTVVELVDLRESKSWEAFDCRMTKHLSYQNLGPWWRILSVLRNLGAKSCVIEKDYICLDYRSEVASFYSQLNVPVSRRSQRLHFFGEFLSSEDVLALNESQAEKYLGYVVWRPGDMPPVGRTVIKTPSYINSSADIAETVNFFEQDLKVEGVPFMQQDERFDVCAHVAVWCSLYSAHKRGVIERKFIADVVSATAREKRPMIPAPPLGLRTDDIDQVIQASGLRALRWELGMPNDIFDVEKDSLLEQELKKVAEIVGNCKCNHDDGCPVEKEYEKNTFSCFVYKFKQAAQECIQNKIKNSDNYRDYEANIELWENDVIVNASKLYDILVAAIARPFITSRWPIYCGTENHALLLCGISCSKEGDLTFFFHDDQNGPYLASSSLSEASKDEFEVQAFKKIPKGFTPKYGDPPFEDRAASIIDRTFVGKEAERSVVSLVIPVPPRCLLDPHAAEAKAWKMIKECGETFENIDVRAQIMMGTDFRYDRRRLFKDHSDEKKLYSMVTLAEWVVYVEGTMESPNEEEKKVVFEFVFDGSSGGRNPMIQFARFKENVMYAPHDGKGPAQGLKLQQVPLISPMTKVPSKIRKAKGR